MNALTRWLVRLTRWSAEHSVIVIVVFATLLAVSIALIRRTTVSGSLQAMLGTEAPAAASLARITSDYRRLDDLLLLATLPPSPASAGAPEQPDQIRLVEFAQRLQIAISSSPTSAALCRKVRYQADPSMREFVQKVMLPAGAFYLDDVGFDALLNRLRPEEMAAQIARNEAAVSAPGPVAQAIAKAVLRDPLRLSELIDARLASTAGLEESDSQTSAEFSDDGQSLLIRVSGVRPASDLYFAQKFSTEIGACAAQANLDGLQIDMGGSYAIGAWASKTIRADDIGSTIVTIILIQVFFIVFYRRASAPLLIGGTAGAGIVIAFGIHAIFVSTITPLTAIAAATLAGLGVDYGIHYLSHYQEHRREGLSSAESSAVTIRGVGLALASACLTTLLGFAALWPSQVAMVRDFALLGSLGLLGALITIYTLMPALMALTDRKPRRSSPPLKIGMISKWVVDRPGIWIAISLVIVAVAVGALAKAGGWPPLESDLTVMHPRPNPPLDATELIRQKYSAMGDSVLIEVRAGSPENLVAATHDVAAALRNAVASSLDVKEVLGLSRLLPDPRVIDERRRRLAMIDVATVSSTFDDALRESLFVSSAYDDYRRFLEQLIAPSNVPNFADVLKFPSVAEQILPGVTVQGGSPPTSTILVARLSHALHDRASRDAAIEGFHRALDGHAGVTVTGTDAVAYELERTIRHDLPRMLAISLVLVILWLYIVFRRPLDVLLSFIPVAFSMIVLLGFVAATGMRLNIVNGVALPLLAGIAVDSGVFFVLSFRQHPAQGGDRALEFRVICTAVIGTTMTNIIGFGSLYWTHTPAVRTLGIVSAVGILAGLWGTLFLLLPLLFIRRSRTATAPAAVISNHPS